MLKQYNGKKREIQSYFYHKVQNKSNIVALAGNNLDLHITDFNLILGNTKKAYVYDINKSVINKFKYLENYQLQLICDNILNCRIERFMDIDLMQTLQSIEGIVYYLFNRQYQTYCNRKQKHIVNTFMFTYSLRKNSRNIDRFLQSLYIDKKINIISKEYITYRDGCPMCTVQIQYNFNL